MKKSLFTILGLVTILSLTACNKEDTAKERIVKKEVYGLNENGDVIKTGNLSLLFKANDEVPYISLKDGATQLKDLRQTTVKGNVDYQKNDKIVKYTNENNISVTFDADKQTITYDDFDAFSNSSGIQGETLAALNSNNKIPTKLKETKYQKGQSLVVDLNSYKNIDIYEHEGEYYLPLATYNDLFLSATGLVNFVYNFKNVYALSLEAQLTNDMFGEKFPTQIGEKFYNTVRKEKVSESYAQFNYQNTQLVFDYFYGCKNAKLPSGFDKWINTDFKNDMLSGDVHKIDNATAYALSYLNDSHTALTNGSPLYKFGEGTAVAEKLSPESVNFDKGITALNNKRKEKDALLGLKIYEQEKTAFVAFNLFDSISYEILSLKYDNMNETNELMAANSGYLMKIAYDELVKQNEIKTVVVDVATNLGGDSSTLAFILGCLIGDFYLDTIDPITGASNRINYQVDINLDGKYDSNDKSLASLGYKIAFVDSKYSFSCGNALPMLAKINNPNVVLLGQTTGGGAYTVKRTFSALGSEYKISSTLGLARMDGTKYVDFESGIAPDIQLTEDEMLTRSTIISKLNGPVA